MKSFVVADWHLGDDRFDILNRPFSSPQEMIDSFVEYHNELVSDIDLVHVVGDAIYQATPSFLSQVDRFKGRKILYRGNHDRNISDEMLLNHFEEIIPEGDGRVIRCGNIDCWVTHYPTQAKSQYFNIVGHVHSCWRIQLNMFNCGVDANWGRPTNIETIPDIFKTIKKFTDEDIWIAYNTLNSNFMFNWEKSYFSGGNYA